MIEITKFLVKILDIIILSFGCETRGARAQNSIQILTLFLKTLVSNFSLKMIVIHLFTSSRQIETLKLEEKNLTRERRLREK